MPFLKKVQEKLGISNTTKGVYLGTPEAEGEIREGHGLLEFFEDYMHVIDDIATEKFIVTGRKGAGKSAVSDAYEAEKQCAAAGAVLRQFRCLHACRRPCAV